ncbi:UPF0182 family protein [Glutamicibacter halophytocola]
MLTTYHVDNPDAFYESNDAWAVPDDPTSSTAGVKRPPYFMSLKMPTQDEASFSLTSTFIPAADFQRATAQRLVRFPIGIS